MLAARDGPEGRQRAFAAIGAADRNPTPQPSLSDHETTTTFAITGGPQMVVRCWSGAPVGHLTSEAFGGDVVTCGKTRCFFPEEAGLFGAQAVGTRAPLPTAARPNAPASRLRSSPARGAGSGTATRLATRRRHISPPWSITDPKLPPGAGPGGAHCRARQTRPDPRRPRLRVCLDHRPAFGPPINHSTPVAIIRYERQTEPIQPIGNAVEPISLIRRVASEIWDPLVTTSSNTR